MKIDEYIFTLHKYFIWADRMRYHFKQILEDGCQSINSKERILANLYMSCWYAHIYVVIEGQKKLGLSDTKIDKLLKSPNVDLLKLYRNGVFHFHKNYLGEPFLGFIQKGQNSVQWVHELHNEFSRFFLNWADYKKGRKNVIQF